MSTLIRSRPVSLNRRVLIRAALFGIGVGFPFQARARPPTFNPTGGGQFMEIEPREGGSAFVLQDLAGGSQAF